MQVLYFY